MQYAAVHNHHCPKDIILKKPWAEFVCNLAGVIDRGLGAHSSEEVLDDLRILPGTSLDALEHHVAIHGYLFGVICAGASSLREQLHQAIVAKLQRSLGLIS